MNDHVRNHLRMQLQQRTSRDGQAQIRLEAETVTILLKHFRADRAVPVLRKIQYEKLGTQGLSAEIFNETADCFPYLLFCHTLDGLKLHTDKQSTLPKMFTAFPKTPLGKAFRYILQICHKRYKGDSRDPCMVVHRVGLRGGLVVYPATSRLGPVSGLSLQYTSFSEDDDDFPSVTIEPFQSLLLRLTHSWEPKFYQTEE